MKKMIKNKKGITLVELLAVIVILAIITAIAVPLIGNLITSTRQSAAAADGNTVYASLRLWALENPQPENDPEVFDFTGDEAANLTERGRLNTTLTGYISTVPSTFNDITFTITGSLVEVTAGPDAEISEYAVKWENNAFVKR